VTMAEVEGWATAVEAGEGRRGYPMPAVSVYGLGSELLRLGRHARSGSPKQAVRGRRDRG
jgi:hypothetical protein